MRHPFQLALVNALILLLQTVSPSTRCFAAEASGATASEQSCALDANCPAEPKLLAHVTEVPVEKHAPTVPGHPLTSVVVTQCNLIVAVYMTMPDGKLLRFDQSASVPAEQLITMAYTATRSERVEVSCNDLGSVGHEGQGPV